MYKNGIYSDVTPSSFGTVTYNPDGGVIAPNYATSYTLLFDTSKTSKHIPAPTRNGYNSWAGTPHSMTARWFPL